MPPGSTMAPGVALKDSGPSSSRVDERAPRRTTRRSSGVLRASPACARRALRWRRELAPPSAWSSPPPGRRDLPLRSTAMSNVAIFGAAPPRDRLDRHPNALALGTPRPNVDGVERLREPSARRRARAFAWPVLAAPRLARRGEDAAPETEIHGPLDRGREAPHRVGPGLGGDLGRCRRTRCGLGSFLERAGTVGFARARAARSRGVPGRAALDGRRRGRGEGDDGAENLGLQLDGGLVACRERCRKG